MRKALPYLAIILLTFIIYLASGLDALDNTRAYSYVYLAACFSHARLDLDLEALRAPPDIEYGDFEDLARHGGRYYIAFPPLPALLIMPFYFIFGLATNQRLFTMALGSINVALAYALMGRIGVSRGVRWMMAALFGFGCCHWFLAAHGLCWYTAQIAGTTFALLALLEAFGRRRTALAGAAAALAFLCRPTLLLLLPFLFLALAGSGRRRATALLAWPAAAVGAYLFYNFLRFGSPLNTGHGLMAPEYLAGNILEHGTFSLRYVPYNVYTMLFMAPRFINRFPFIVPHLQGQSLLLTTPALIYALKSGASLKVRAGAWLSITLILCALLTYHANGHWQFGYRFSLDFIPLALVLVATGLAERPSKTAVAVFIACFILNLEGVIWLRLLP